MKKILIAVMALSFTTAMVSCKSETDKLIDQYEEALKNDDKQLGYEVFSKLMDANLSEKQEMRVAEIYDKYKDEK